MSHPPRPVRPPLTTVLGQRVVIADGAKGAMLQVHHPQAKYFST